jgi:hypothetical protein
MSAQAWVISYAIGLAVWIWILLWGGAEWLEGRFTAWLFDLDPNWSADSIKLFGWAILVVTSIWFVIGLRSSEWRSTWP